MTPDIASIALIAATFVLAVFVFRGGQSNPTSTGRVAADVHTVNRRLDAVETEMKQVKDELKDVATTSDIKAVEERIDGHHQLAQQTARGVERIERFLIEKALK